MLTDDAKELRRWDGQVTCRAVAFIFDLGKIRCRNNPDLKAMPDETSKKSAMRRYRLVQETQNAYQFQHLE